MSVADVVLGIIIWRLFSSIKIGNIAEGVEDRIGDRLYSEKEMREFVREEVQKELEERENDDG